MLHGKQASRRVLGVGIDRVAEQKQLQHRQRDDETQSYRIAPHLQPLLAQESREAPDGECLHDASPLALSMWMNTSSRRGSASCQEWTAPSRDRMAFSRTARSVPAIRRARPNTAAASIPGVRRNRRASASKSPSVASKMTSPERAETSAAAPCTTIRPSAR